QDAVAFTIRRAIAGAWGVTYEGWHVARIHRCMRNLNSLTAAFIAAVLALLTAALMILSFRMQGTLIELSDRTDRAVSIGGEINAMFSGEVGSIVGFQA